MKNQAYIIVFSVFIFALIGKWILDVKPADRPQTDLVIMWGLSKHVMDGDKKLLIKHRGEYLTYANLVNFKQIAHSLSQKLQFPEQNIRMHEDHPVYETSFTETGGVKVSLVLLGNDEKQTNLVITRESERENVIGEAKQWKKNMAEKLRAVGIRPNWNIIIQGKLQTKGKEDETARKFFKSILVKTNAIEVERYHDIRTISVTYHTTAIQNLVKSGDSTVNLQAAAHQITGSNEWRATIGTPLITTEY